MRVDGQADDEEDVADSGISPGRPQAESAADMDLRNGLGRKRCYSSNGSRASGLFVWQRWRQELRPQAGKAEAGQVLAGKAQPSGIASGAS